MPPTIDTDYAKAVAAHCGAHPGVVAEILQLSHEKKCLYHGISMSPALEDVRDSGIRPRITNDGVTSETVWTFGKCLFSRDGTSPESTPNSTFYHHAHNELGMSLAISNPSEMDMYDIFIQELSPPDAQPGYGDGTFVIREILPRDYYAFLHVGLPIRVYRGGSDPEWSRRVGIAGEAKMMELLVDYLRGDFVMGKGKEITIENIP